MKQLRVAGTGSTTAPGPEAITRTPAPPLRDAVAGLVLFRGRDPVAPPRLERSIPSGSVTLMVNLAEDEFRTWDVRGGRATPVAVGGAVFAGARSAPTVIDTDEQRHLVCVEFHWAGAAAFLGLPVEELRDQLVGLDQLWGRAGAVLRERLVEAPDPLRVLHEELVTQVRRAPRPEPGVRLAVAELQRGRPVQEVADRLGWTGKRLRRAFREAVGLTPKRFARVRRLQRVVHGLPRGEAVDWAGVAAGHGYADQAHLIGEFRELAGITPAAYRAAVGAEPNHVPLDLSCNPRGGSSA
jgi:AraC-like DNA-binding protein